jgi:type II secretion system protein G
MSEVSFARGSKAFTLIELLIVVAIIAILAAIAVPNFLEAQTRAKVSRAKADLRTLATAMESYRIDNNAYPKGNQNNVITRLVTDPATDQYLVGERLTTPISYITSVTFPDPFKARKRSGTINGTTGDSTVVDLTPAELAQEGTYKYAALASPPGTAVLALTSNTATSAKTGWFMWTAGPGGIKPQLAGTGLFSTMPIPTDTAILAWMYDPTNGTVSNGSIYRVGGSNPGDDNPGGKMMRFIEAYQK